MALHVKVKTIWVRNNSIDDDTCRQIAGLVHIRRLFRKEAGMMSLHAYEIVQRNVFAGLNRLHCFFDGGNLKLVHHSELSLENAVAKHDHRGGKLASIIGGLTFEVLQNHVLHVKNGLLALAALEMTLSPDLGLVITATAINGSNTSSDRRLLRTQRAV